MSLDKSRIPKRGNSSRKFIPEKQRKTMTDPFVDWIKRSRSDKEETVSGRMVETRSQKTSEERRELLEVEVNTDHTMNDNQEVNELEGRGRRLASESTPVEQGHDFATSTGTLDREEMSELSDISTEVATTRRSPTDNTMMASGTGKQITSSSFSERMKNTLGNFFPFSMGGGAGNDGESQEDEEDEEEQGDFGSQVSLNSSIQENEAYVGRETGTMDKFGVVTTISKEANTPGQSKDFAIRTSSEPQTGESRTRGLGNALADPEIDNEKTSRQRVKARISTSTKLPGTDRVTPPLVTPLVDNGAALEEALNNIVGSLGEQNEQMSIRMSELERAVHIERESLREEINRNRQEVGRSEKRLKERTDEHMTKNLSRMTREAEQRELRLRADMEKLRIQQEQSLGSLDTKIDAMMERRTQAIMDRLDGLLSSKSGPKEGEPNSGGPSREPRVNFNEHQRRKTYGSTRGRGSSSGYATRGNTAWGPNSRANSTGNRQTSDERPTQGTHATGRSDSGNRGHASPKRSHAGQAGNAHGDSDCRDAPHTEPSTRCEDTQAGHSRDATAMATAFEPLNRSLETFLTRLSGTNERSEKSRRVFKKPRCYKDESDGCIDTWIEVMKLHFEEEDLSERQECSALTSNLEGTALNCVMAKKQYQRDTAEKIFEILLNRFGSGVQGHQAMMRFEKRRQREDETIDKFLDDLNILFHWQRAGLKCKPSKCEILRDSIKYLGRMVDRHGVRPDPEAVEAVLTWKAPRTDTQLMSFLGFANYYREFIKGYADKVYPMQKLMRNKGKKFEWNDEAQVAFENIKRELCEAPVLGMPSEKGMYVLDTDASVVAISGILHQEQEWNGSKVLSDTEMKYGAPKAEMFAVVTFVEKYRAYLGSAPFKLRVDNRALSWLKTYSMDQSYIGRWIVRLDGYHMIIEHRMRDKHQNADSLSKKTESYERLEQKQANQAEVKEGFSFLDKETYEELPLTRWLDKSGHPIPGHPELPVEKAAEIKILSKEDPVPLDLLLRSNLVQQELSRMNINSLSLLDKTVQVTPQVMRMLGGLLEREVTRDDPEWTAAVASLTVSEKVKIMPSRRQHEENERDCRTIVQQLVSSIPQEILTSTSYGQKGQESGRQKKTVTFVDRDKDGEVVKQNLLQDYLSGEKDEEKKPAMTRSTPGTSELVRGVRDRRENS